MVQGMIFTVPFLANEYISTLEASGEQVPSMRMWGMGGDAVPLDIVYRMEKVGEGGGAAVMLPAREGCCCMDSMHLVEKVR